MPPPREYLIVLAVLAASGIPAGPLVALRDCALVAAGALIGILVAMAPALSRRRVISQARALSQAWAAVSDVLSTAGTPAAADARGRAVTQVADAREALSQARISGDDSQSRSLAAVRAAPGGHRRRPGRGARAVHRGGHDPRLRDEVTLAIDELAMLALGVPFDRPPPPGADHPIKLSGYPRTQAATELLASALA